MIDNIIFGIGIGIAICVILNIIIDEFWSSRNRRFDREVGIRALDAKSDAYDVMNSVISIHFPYMNLNGLKPNERKFLLEKSIEHIDRVKVCLTGEEFENE